MTAATRIVAAAGALGLGVLLAACGGSSAPRPDLVVVSTRDGDYAIYAMNADGGSQKRLSDEDVDVSSARGVFFQIDPAWSPDARRIAFASRRGGTFDIYAMRIDGTRPVRLTSTRDHDVQPTWSPDGQRIAFARGRPGHLMVMDADGSGVRRLTEDDAEEADPAWSPDGRWILYSRRQPGGSVRELWIVRPDGTGRRKITSFDRATFGPAWSPNSRRIAFAANLDGSIFDIYSISANGKSLRRHTQSPEDAFEPSWSPNGRTIAFSRTGSIVTVDLEGNLEEITDAENNDSSPVWNPRPPREEE